jgi:hypothetical protein
MLPKRVGVAHLFGFAVVLPQLESGTTILRKGCSGYCFSITEALARFKLAMAC